MMKLNRAALACLALAGAAFSQAPVAQPSIPTPTIMIGACTGVVTNLLTIVLWPFGTATTTCVSNTSVTGTPIRAATVSNLRVKAKIASSVGSGVVAVYKNGTIQALTCTLGTATSCQDLVNSFTTVSNDSITVKVQSLGATLTAGPTYSSGASACTNGTQVVTFSNGTSGTNATGTITVSGNVPTGAVTVTGVGNGYAAATPPTQGTVATCTGTAAFTGGTVTVETMSDLQATFEVQ